MKKYIGFIGSDRFEVEAKNNQQASYQTARLFIKKYNLPGNVRPSALATDVHPFLVPEYKSPISSEDLVDFILRRSGNGAV
jgi:hypothetical protein